MRFYETMYIVHPALEAGRLKDIIELVNKALKEKGSEVLYNELWGKKKLSYFIDKQKYGTYILVQYKGDGLKNNQFNMELEHNPNILAYLTTSIEESSILKDSKDINSQIDGNDVSEEVKKGDSSKVTEEESSNENQLIDESNDEKIGESHNNKEEQDSNNASEENPEKMENTEDEKEKVEE